MIEPPRSEPPTKEALRALFRARRAGLSAPEYERRSAAIVRRTQDLPELEQARTVHLYWPLTQRREVDTRALFSWLHAKKKQIVLPVVTTFEQPSGGPARLQHRRYTGPEGMRPNRWGIHEPTAGETVPLEEIDVVVVPALGAGRNGHRIGHGFGYYDEFLRRLNVPTVCLVYTDCLVEAVPAEAHDVPVSIIVTEQEVIRLPPPL